MQRKVICVSEDPVISSYTKNERRWKSESYKMNEHLRNQVQQSVYIPSSQRIQK